MPTPQSVSVCNLESVMEPVQKDETLTDDMCLLKLRTMEYLAYHHICEVFRAQGHLTPEKLRLLREIAATLSISDLRHRLECGMVVNNKKLNAIAECVAGPDTHVEWKREAKLNYFSNPRIMVDSASALMANAVAKAVREKMESAYKSNNTGMISMTINLRSLFPEETKTCETESNQHIKNPNTDIMEETPTLKTEDEIKEEDKDAELSSSISTTSEPEEPQSLREIEHEEKVTEMEREEKPDSDTILMPPPPVTVVSPCPDPADPPIPVSLPTNPNVITVPPSSSIPTLSPSPAVITVPPSSSILTLSPPHPAVITVPPPTSLPDTIVSPPTVIPAPSGLLTTPPCEIDECTPVLSEDMQFVSFSESIDSSLPSLVVVPPPDPVPHSSSFSPTLVLPSGMSLQLTEESEDSKKRKLPLSQDNDDPSNELPEPSSKTMALSHISKMTPVMVSVANMSAAGLKVTPTISRAKMAVTTQASLAPSTQKVIIVSNSASSSAPVIQRSLNVPMGVPFIRASQPRSQHAPVSGGLSKVRPKMVTVPTKCRSKSTPLMIPVSGHNLQLKNTFAIKQDNLSVVDTCGKKVPLGSGVPTKILPKPQSSMFIVNTSQGHQKITNPMSLHAGGQSTHMLSPRMMEGPGSKQNVVILQKGSGKSQRVTLTNTSKDLVQKLMSKKCVVIQSSKSLPKTISPKLPPTSMPVSVASSSNNVVVLDLSQEQFRQNLNNTTLAEILQASGILAASSATPPVTATPPLTTSVAVPEPSNNWLSVEASKSLALEEVTLPIGQSESIVTLDQAVELLGETVEQSAASVVEVESQGIISDSTDQIFSITPEELAATSVSFMTESIEADNSNSSQVLVDALMDEGPEEAVSHCYSTHRDGAVTIQHSNIDMPAANMSLEDYSSQQLENQGLN